MSNKKPSEMEIQFEAEKDFLHQLELFKAQNNSRIKTSLTAKHYPKTYENPEGPSLTIPDQALTLKQILDRYAHGIPMNQIQNKEPIWTNDPNGIGLPIESLDLAERQFLMEQNQQNIVNIQNSLQALQDPKPDPVVQTPTPPPQNPTTGL